jgi:hypothetical protein
MCGQASALVRELLLEKKRDFGLTFGILKRGNGKQAGGFNCFEFTCLRSCFDCLSLVLNIASDGVNGRRSLDLENRWGRVLGLVWS